MNKKKLMNFKKFTSLLLLVAALCVYFGVRMDKNKIIIITGFVLMFVTMIIDWKFNRCPYCHHYLNKGQYSNICPYCGKDMSQFK